MAAPGPITDGDPRLSAGRSATPAHGKPLGRRERKKLETRRRIFRSAFELFAAKGYERTTVEEISERADVAKGTVFNYFPHKKAFLLAAHLEWMTGLEGELGPPESWQGPAREQLGRVLDHLADLSLHNRELSRMVIFESMRETFLHMDTAEGPDPQEGVRVLEGLAGIVLAQAKKRAEVRPEVDEELAASLIAAIAFSTLVRWLVKDGSAEEMKAALAAKLDIIFTGLTP